MRGRAPTIVANSANLIPHRVATCRPATSSGMKLHLKGLKKLRPRWPLRHYDLKTRHVKKLFGQDVLTAELHGQLPPSDAEDWVALSELPSQDGQNEAPLANVSRMSENLMADAPNAFKDTQGIQTSSEYDASTTYIKDSTRIESSPRSNDSAQDIKDPDANPLSSPFYGSPLGYNHLKRRDSPILAREFSPDSRITILPDLTGDGQAQEDVSERTDHPNIIPGEQDHLDPSYRQVYPPGSILENLDRSESVLEVEDRPQSILNRPHYPEPGLGLQSYPGPLQEEPNHSQSTPNTHSDELPVLAWSYHSEISLERPHLDSTSLGTRDFSELISHKLDRPELGADQQDHAVPFLDQQDDSRRYLDQQEHKDSGLDNQDHLAPIEMDQAETFTEVGNHTEFCSAGQNQDKFILDKQSHPQSFGSQKSHVANDQQRRRLRRGARLYNLLSRSLQTRARAYESRSQLRQLRSEISNADETFMKLVREKWFQGSLDDVALQASFEKLQDARNRYGPLEETYNTLEEQLNREEYEAKELEGRILESEIPAPDFIVDSRSSSAGGDGSEASEIFRELYHPLYEAYLSRLGDADLCREAIAELMIEHDNLLHAQELRWRVGMELSPDDQTTLGNFPAAETKLLNELRRIDEDVELLRLECVQEGLVDEKESQNEVELEVQDVEGGNDEEIDLSQTLIGSLEPEQADYNKYPLLLEKPEEKEDENKSKVLLTDFKEGDVGDRITCWLLHKLRTSGLEVELLARHTDGLDRNADTQKWQKEVLEFWFFDGANLPPSAYQVEPSFTAFPTVSPISDLNMVSHRHLGTLI
jgi:hypothetical protein